MKIDFHLHSPASIINGDSIKWISPLNTIKSLFKNKVKAFSFTDHNIFDLNLYYELKKIINKNMIIFPGVEINILKDNGVIAHIIVVFDNKLSNLQLTNLQVICKNNLRKKGIRIVKLNEIFKDFVNIKIPHVGKSDYFLPSELKLFQHDAIEIVSEKNSNYQSWLKKNNDKSVVAFSDTHIWYNDKYPQNSFLYTEIDFDGTFSNLKAKLKQNQQYFKSQI